MTYTSDRDPAFPSDPTSAAAPMFPPGRYGRRRESSGGRPRIVVVAIALAIIAVMGLVSIKLYKQYGNPQFTPTVLKLSNVKDSEITVTFRVTKPDGGAAICTVDALASNGSALGTAQVPVPAGTDVQVTATISTSARAYIARVPSCHAAG